MNTTKDASKNKTIFFVMRDAGYFLSHRVDLARALRKKNYRVFLVSDRSALDDRTALATEVDGFIDLPLLNVKKKPIKVLFGIVKFAKELAKVRPDVVFSVTIASSIISGVLTRLLAIPHVVLFAGLGSVFYSRQTLGKKILRTALAIAVKKKHATIIAQNPEIEVALRRNNVIRDTAACFIISGSGLDCSKFFEHEPLFAGSIRVALVSRMLVDKGVIEFIEATRVVRKQRPEILIELVGPIDPLNPTAIKEQELRKLCKHAGVDYRGKLSDIPGYLKSVDILCLPSYHEGLPRSLLEGAAAGCLLIASAIPGCTDIVKDGETGYLVKVRDAQDLADKILVGISNPEISRRLASNGRDFVVKRFSSDSIIPKYVSVIESIALSQRIPSGHFEK